MRARRWRVQFATMLLLLALALYAARWLLFTSAGLHNEMLRFLLGDVAFLFIQVPLVSLFIDEMMQRRQRDEILRKLNMVIGAFFSETGAELLGEIASADTKLLEVRDELVPNTHWTSADYEQSRRAFESHAPKIELTACDLEKLKDTLQRERQFLIGLLGNQSLLEHESFADLLWALTHLGEELAARPDLSKLSAPDAAHIAGDIKRAYVLLGVQWLYYLAHLQTQYPYLFSLAVRTNPLDPTARVAVAQ